MPVVPVGVAVLQANDWTDADITDLVRRTRAGDRPW
jgi:hypothetical protein